MGHVNSKGFFNRFRLSRFRQPTNPRGPPFSLTRCCRRHYTRRPAPLTTCVVWTACWRRTRVYITTEASGTDYTAPTAWSIPCSLPSACSGSTPSVNPLKTVELTLENPLSSLATFLIAVRGGWCSAARRGACARRGVGAGPCCNSTALLES